MNQALFWIKFLLHGLAAAAAAVSPQLANPPASKAQWAAVGIGALGAAAIAMKAYLSEASSNL
jgi:hypothetical protein